MRFSRTTIAGAVVALAGLLVPLSLPASAGQADHVRVARGATKDFAHPPAAKAAGYGLFKDADGIACIAMKGMGAMGVHYANGSLLDQKIQLRHPEALVYRFTKNGYLRLAALEYIVLRKDWRQAHGQTAARPELFGHRFNVAPAGNRFGLPAYYSLHAWVWYHNPAGQFMMFNPRVHCPAGV
ncbi:MAG: hypothetical protein QOK15_2635 [Nocardioidaceae bacterium]|nr:hypothetical protein [Nocardioidaceae bacterium]